jgi:recombinational DNA repair ATPase RecF
VISIKYLTNNDTSKQTILNRLAAERNLGFTQTGPQKHDVLFEYNGSHAKTAASRGENRTIIVAMYYAIIKLAKQYRGDPVLLFDDIFGEIDDERRNNISLQQDLQTFITSIDVAAIGKGVNQLSL